VVSIEVSISTNQSGHSLLKFWQFFHTQTGLAKQIIIRCILQEYWWQVVDYLTVKN